MKGLFGVQIPRSNRAVPVRPTMCATREGRTRPASLASRPLIARCGRVVIAGVVPVSIMLSVPGMAAGAGLDQIADQPGVTSPAQPGTAAPAAPPAPSGDGQAQPDHNAQQYPEQPPEVRNGASLRPQPSSDPAPQVELQDLHLPEPVPPVAPIAPPDNTIRIGEWQAPSPDWMPTQVRDWINNTSAGAEAQVATALDSVGVPPGRSDRVSGATLAGAGAGGAAGAVIAGGPVAAIGAAVGALVGGTVGGIAGAALGTLVPVPILGTVTSGVFGTAIGAAAGAAVGAAVAGIPVAIVGAIAGGTVGAGFGTGVGVGQP
ncbi:MAG: hypothetical protein JWN03_2017 [Nocardia sp.]|nr:hypothetical protein [Nocardia sp.]